MEKEVEVWKDIKDYEGMYQASNFGRVKSLNRKDCTGKNQYSRFLKPAPNVKGYLNVVFCKNGKMRTFSVHRLVAILFVDNPNNLSQVNHKDGVRDNNHYRNLEHCSERENSCHRYKSVKTTSKFIGVSYHKQTGKWRSYITFGRKMKHLGLFDKESDAYNVRVKYEKDNNIQNKYL